MEFSFICGQTPVQIFEYRGFNVPIYLDDYGQCYYTSLDGQELGFGSFNSDYEHDIMYLIDKHLDLLYQFPEYKFSKLEWFQNGKNRDIRLVLNGRVLKVFLVEKPEEISIDKLKKESLRVLKIVKTASKNTV